MHNNQKQCTGSQHFSLPAKTKNLKIILA